MPDPIDQIIARYDDEAWRGVPYLVVAAYHRVVEPAFRESLAKHAAADGAFLRGPADAFSLAQRPLAGPHPLSAAIVGGLIGSGLGYGGGYLAEKVLGPETVQPGKLRKTMAVAGGLAGAVPGAVWQGVNMANPAETGGGLRSAVSGWPFAEAGKASRFDGRIFVDPAGDLRTKLAAGMADSGALYMPTIPVDAFNNAVWQDVHATPALGTKDPWGTNEQPLGTPPPYAAAISGIVAGAGAAANSGYVSPYHVAMTAAVAGGKGYAAGLLAGKTLGALAGLTPEAQATLRRLGTWGGIISGVAGAVFGDG